MEKTERTSGESILWTLRGARPAWHEVLSSLNTPMHAAETTNFVVDRLHDHVISTGSWKGTLTDQQIPLHVRKRAGQSW